jgi:hypothetical protein
VTRDEAASPGAGEHSPDESDDGLSALGVVAEVAKVAGEESAPVLVEMLLEVVFSDAARARILQQAEEGLRELVESTLDALPASASNGGLRREMDRAERELHAMLHESIDSIFSGSARAEFQGHMEEAAHHIAEGDSAAAKEQVGEALQCLLSEILKVLQGHWAQTLRLLLGITARALEATLAAHVKEAFASIATRPAQELEEKIEPFQEKLAAKAEELRERLVEARDAMQERVAEAKEQMQDRLGGGMPGAANQSGRQSRFGAPPSRRPPPGAAKGRTLGKAPGGRPPSISR